MDKITDNIFIIQTSEQIEQSMKYIATHIRNDQQVIQSINGYIIAFMVYLSEHFTECIIAAVFDVNIKL